MSTPVTGLFNYEDYLNLRKNGIAPVCGIPLIFVSAASSMYALNVINIHAGIATYSGQPLLLWPWNAAGKEWNSIWQLTPEGFIISPMTPGYAVGISDDNALCVLQKDSTDQTQLWSFNWFKGSGIDGYVITSASGMSIVASSQCYLSNGQQQSGVLSLVDLSNGTPTSDQLWITLPAVPVPPNSFYIQSDMSGKPGEAVAPYVVTANGDNVFSSPWVPGSASQLWRFNPDGTISPSGDYAETQALTSTSTSNKDGNDAVTLSNAGGSPTAAQIWTYDPKTLFLTVNTPATGVISLNVADNKTANPLITYAEGGSNSQWYVFPEQSVMTGQWFYIQTQINQNVGNPNDAPGPVFVLTVTGTDPEVSSAVVINQLQPGALTQLWQLTSQGNLVCAVAPSMVLSVDSTSGDAVTLQAQGASGQLQYWCALPNGLFVILNGSTPQYLCPVVTIGEGGATPALMTNGEVVTYPSFPLMDSAAQASASWKIEPYEPDTSGQWFTIQTATEAKQNGTPYLLTAGDDWVTLQTQPPLGGNMLSSGAAAINQLWRITLQGTIISALNPGLYLTGTSKEEQSATVYGLTIAPGQQANVNQVWNWGQTWKWEGIPNTKYHVLCGQLINTGLQLALTAQEWANSGNVTLEAATAGGSTDLNQGWLLVPHNPAYEQPTTIRNTGNKGAYPGLYLQVEGTETKVSGKKTYAYSVAVGQRGDNAAASTWQFIYPGYIASSLNSDIVLCLEPSKSADTSNTTYGPGVIVALRSLLYEPFQLWEADQQGRLFNKQTGDALTVVVTGSAPDYIYTLTTQALSDASDTSLVYWDFNTGLALQATLVMPSVPFPVNDGDASNYTDICKAIGLPGGIREQYQNLAAPLNSYQLAINMLGLTNSSYATVVSQLNEEIVMVTAIQQFFTQANTLHQGLSQAQAMAVAEMITACAFPNGTTMAPPKKKKGWIADIVEGLLYTGLNLVASFAGVKKDATLISKGISVGLPFLANVMSAGLTSYQAKKTSQPNSKLQAALQNIYNYELSVFQLQQSLLDMFETIGASLAEMEAAILADWGKINEVYAMIKNTDSIDSLYWPASASPVITKQMLGGYASKVLQTLIPSNPGFYINGYLHGASGSGLQTDLVTFYGQNLDGTTSEWVAAISPDVMNLVWSYGTSPTDFYRQLNGWNILTKYTGSRSTTGIDGDACIVITIFNMTGMPMTLNVAGMSFISNTANMPSREIPPYGAQQLAGFYYTFGGICYTPSGDFTVVETGNNNTVLAGNLQEWYNIDNKMEPVNFTFKISSPYYQQKYKQSPPYLANMSFYEIYIGLDRASNP